MRELEDVALASKPGPQVVVHSESAPLTLRYPSSPRTGLSTPSLTRLQLSELPQWTWLRRPFSRRGRGKVNDKERRHDDNANGPNAQTLFFLPTQRAVGEWQRGSAFDQYGLNKTAGWIETADSSPVCPARNNVSPSGFPNQLVTAMLRLYGGTYR